MEYSRRKFAVLAASLGALESCKDEQAASATKEEKLERLRSHAFKFEELPTKVNQNGSKTHAVFTGLTHANSKVDVHETELPAGGSPHPPHHHVHEEMFLIRTGLLDATVNGETTRLTPGSVFYVNSNDVHGVVNPGPDPVQYFVVALGTDA